MAKFITWSAQADAQQVLQGLLPLRDYGGLTMCENRIFILSVRRVDGVHSYKVFAPEARTEGLRVLDITEQVATAIGSHYYPRSRTFKFLEDPASLCKTVEECVWPELAKNGTRIIFYSSQEV